MVLVTSHHTCERYDNEQADLVARVALEQKLSDCKAHKDLLEGFIEQEIM